MTEAARVTRWEVTSTDPEFAHQVLRDAYCDFDVRPSGSTDGFAFSHTVTAAPAFRFARLGYNTAARFDADGIPGSLVVDTGVAGRLTTGGGRDRVTPDPGVPVLLPPDEPGWWFETEDLVLDVLTLDRPTVEREAAAFGLDPGRLRFSGMRAVSPPALDYWRRTVAHIRDDVLDSEEVSRSPLVLGQATRSLATALLTAFPNNAAALLEGLERADRMEPAVIRRAVLYIDDHCREDVGVGEIAEAARVGVRGLQQAFRRYRGCTPLEYLRRVRMERAHRDLQSADPSQGDTVAVIAARWGFAHAGRFSVQYRNAFGRLPSETLRA